MQKYHENIKISKPNIKLLNIILQYITNLRMQKFHRVIMLKI